MLPLQIYSMTIGNSLGIEVATGLCNITKLTMSQASPKYKAPGRV